MIKSYTLKNFLMRVSNILNIILMVYITIYHFKGLI